jgi:hypothetical protein
MECDTAPEMPQRARKRKCEAPHLAQSIAEALAAAAPQRASKPPATQYVSPQLQFLPPHDSCALSPAARRCASEQARAIVRAEDPLLEQLLQVRAITTRRQSHGHGHRFGGPCDQRGRLGGASCFRTHGRHCLVL